MIQFLVIIPIYNSQNTLRYTLDSLKNQTYTNYKAILVDDGSTDSSYQIAQEYTQDDRIILHKQKNSGVSIARNKALKIAQEIYEQMRAKDIYIYICFLDSDDLLENFALEHYKNIIEENKDIQCILSNSVYYANDDYTNKKLQENYFFDKEIISTNLISPKQIAFHLRNEWHSPCMYYYNADFLFSTNINFIETNILHEDNLYHTSIMLKTEKLYINNIAVYTIVKSKDSLTRSNLTLQKAQLEVKSFYTIMQEYEKLLISQESKFWKKFLKRKIRYHARKLFKYILYTGYFDIYTKKEILKYRKYFSFGKIIKLYMLDIFPNIIKNKSKL